MELNHRHLVIDCVSETFFTWTEAEHGDAVLLQVAAVGRERPGANRDFAFEHGFECMARHNKGRIVRGRLERQG